MGASLYLYTTALHFSTNRIQGASATARNLSACFNSERSGQLSFEFGLHCESGILFV